MTSAEIAEKTNCSLVAVQVSIRRLLKDVSENLEVRTLTDEEKIKKYGRSIGCKVNIYWLDE